MPKGRLLSLKRVDLLSLVQDEGLSVARHSQAEGVDQSGPDQRHQRASPGLLLNAQRAGPALELAPISPLLPTHDQWSELAASVLACNPIQPRGGSNLYALGVPEIVIQRILRHANVSTTATYYIKTAAHDVKNAMEKLEKHIPQTPQIVRDTYGTLEGSEARADQTIQ
jgi:hypothetical protein